MDDEALHTLIAQKLQDGRLPSSSVPRVFGGPGNGETCDACDAVITKEQMGIEGIALAAGGGRPMQVHASCFQIWETERRKFSTGREQVKCTKCSKPIALTDIIESTSGLLSHLDCSRPHGLTPEERALFLHFCWDHVVVQCPICNVSFHYTGLAADILGGSGTNLCPRCRLDLTEAVRAHLFRCATLPAAIRLRAQELRDAAQRLVKETQQLRNTSDVLIREAEAALFRAQQALREAMPRRAAAS